MKTVQIQKCICDSRFLSTNHRGLVISPVTHRWKPKRNKQSFLRNKFLQQELMVCLYVIYNNLCYLSIFVSTKERQDIYVYIPIASLGIRGILLLTSSETTLKLFESLHERNQSGTLAIPILDFQWILGFQNDPDTNFQLVDGIISINNYVIRVPERHMAQIRSKNIKNNPWFSYIRRTIQDFCPTNASNASCHYFKDSASISSVLVSVLGFGYAMSDAIAELCGGKEPCPEFWKMDPDTIRSYVRSVRFPNLDGSHVTFEEDDIQSREVSYEIQILRSENDSAKSMKQV